MSWVPVQEELMDSPKVRRLAKALRITNAEVVGLLVKLWSWGQKNAAQTGLIRDADLKDIQYIFAGYTNLSLPKVVAMMLETGWIDRRDGQLYLHDWDIWQEQWYKALARREYAANKQREYRAIQEDASKGAQLSLLGSDDADDQKKSKYSKAFEEVWLIYPRKDEKSMAYNCYKARLNDGFSEEELLEATKAYASKVLHAGTEKKFIKQGKTFFGPNTPFTDFIPKDKAPDIADWSNPFVGYGEG